MVYHEDGTASRKLLDRLGLPLDTPVVEWHAWGPLETPLGACGRFAPAQIVWEVTGPSWGGRLTYREGVRFAVPPTEDTWLWLDLRMADGYGYGKRMLAPAGAEVAWAADTTEGFLPLLAGYVAYNPSQSNNAGNQWMNQPPQSGNYADAPAGFWGRSDPGSCAFYFGPKVYDDPASTDDEPTGTLADYDPGDESARVYGWVYDEDRTAALVDYSTRHGRSSPLDNVSALTSSVTLARGLLTDAIPTSGERFRLTLNADVATALGIPDDERPRFTGEITDVDVTAEEQLSLVSVTGVGRSSRLGRVPVTGTRPAELDGSRVRRALYKAAVFLPLDLGTFDPGTVTMLPADWTSGGDNARGVVDQVTQDSLGQLVEHRSGRLDWHDAEHRRDLTSSVTLDGSSHIIKPFRWSQAVATVVNIAEVTYGDEGDAEGRDTVKVTDPRSADVATGVGPYGVQIDSQLQDRDDAYHLASTIVGRYAEPAWMLPDLTVDIVRTAGNEAGEVLALSHGDKITASGLPPDGPFAAGDLFVEGTTESFQRTAWRVSLSVADPAIAGVGVRWVDLDLATDETWSGVDPAMTWLDAATAAPEDF